METLVVKTGLVTDNDKNDLRPFIMNAINQRAELFVHSDFGSKNIGSNTTLFLKLQNY